MQLYLHIDTMIPRRVNMSRSINTLPLSYRRTLQDKFNSILLVMVVFICHSISPHRGIYHAKCN